MARLGILNEETNPGTRQIHVIPLMAPPSCPRGTARIGLEMATEVVASSAAAACCYGGEGWSRTAVYRDGEDSQAFRISKLADHGSISFGRYESEGLAWEKFSVFSPNRRKEDVEKSTAPGFVAQKKAYFEEYFKGFRAMKGLFKRESGVESSIRTGKENGAEMIDHDSTKWGSCSSSSYAVPIQVLEKEDNADLVSEHNVSTMTRGECGKGKGQSQGDGSSIGNPDALLKDGLKCSKNGNRAKQAKKQISAKGSVASVASIPKLGTDLGKRSGGLKPSVSRSVTTKLVKEINPAQASTSTKSNHARSLRELGEVQKSTASGVHVKSTREKMVSPTKTKTSLVKPNVTSTSSGKLPVSAQNTKGTTITGHQKRPSLANRNCNEVGKKSLSPSGCQSGGEPENLRPKAMSTDPAANNASKAGAKSARITGRGEKAEKGMTAPNARIGREPKPSPSKVRVIHKTSKDNTEHKISSSRVGLPNEMKETRQRIPTWRRV
ncbi:unnamed protein product [Linum tenue]|uniref:Uncharacterized protein n=1 Tax=Linum tenue TaxID=586396 RepID=A0AAV0RFN6_9ROSI|nr:unnamed protein product [Linum tenue]